MPKTIDEIRNAFFHGDYQVDRPRFIRYEENHIIDTNQSIEWNKQKVIELNEQNKKDLRHYREQCDLLYKQMKSDIIAALNVRTNNEYISNKIYDFCHNEWSNNMPDMFYFLDEICSIILIAINKTKEKEE